MRVQADELAASFAEFYPDHATFVDSATWMDDIKGGFKAFNDWHYIHIPHDPDNLLSHTEESTLPNNDIVWAIEEAVRTLRNPATNQFEKALMLKVLIHCVADIHQPLHCASHYSHAHPDGDSGGTFFIIQGMPMRNLHALWDSGAGLFPSESQAIKALASHLVQTFPKPAASTDVAKWARDSHDLAARFAFQLEEDTTPSPEYLAQVQAISAEQAALAGHRLAHLLNISLITSDLNK